MIKIPPVTPLDWLIFSAVGLIVLLILFSLMRRLWRGKPKPPYQQQPLFSPDASTALHLLDEAVGQKVRGFAAVSLSELLVLNPALKKAQREPAQHAIYGKKLDFVLCSPQDLSVKAAVILTDDSLNKKNHKKQQQLLQHIQATGLAIIQLSPKAWPSVQALHDNIIAVCNQPTTPLPSSHQGRVEPTLSLPNEEQDEEPEIKL